ncbi:SPRY-domain-containing protein [Rhizopogon vinicolor AM-OR11-026]|uniref:SPRY-domain-containing protein n=1 Tax=Rhizopogon vinicolor AM-OR11-026 TaxID=1314800 RepID=A0A1B7NFI3_9AGAM|nr:SPRY-domain-containing protein [Rhizopogon vinicolor AM-OR11-026]
MAVASSPPVRSTARSFTQPNPSILSGTGTAPAHVYYEPRIIRADTACPTSSSVSPSRARRASGTGVRAPSTHRPALANPSAGPMAIDIAPFSRPSYLDHSALRHLLQTDTSPQLPSSPKIESVIVRADYGVGRRGSQRSPSFDSDEEEMSYSGELSSRPQQEHILISPAPLRLPTRWSDEYRNPLLSVSADGRDLNYQGSPGSSDKDAAAARTIFPIPPACGIYYYEVEVTSKTNSNKGLVSREFKPSRLPGWEKNSWGYHGDDGSSFAAEKTGTPYGPQFGAGDIIGCGIDFSQNRAFYTKNGALLGSVFDNIGKDCDVYPAVGLCHPGESVRANFGHEPFKFDIEDHVLQQRNAVWTRIQSAPWTSPLVGGEGKDLTSASTSNTDTRVKSQINDLVLAYLSHHGYVRTARAFEAQSSARGGLSTLKSSNTFASSSTSRVSEQDQIMDMDDVNQTPIISPTPMDDIDIRTRIVHAVLAGDIDTALSDTQTHFPRALDADAGLVLFKLRCRKFVELVLGAAELKKRMRAQEAEMNVEMDGDDKGSLDGMGMDVDDGADASSGGVMSGYGGGSGNSSAIPIKPKRKTSFASYSLSSLSGATAAQYGSALENAVAYGQELQSDYKDRPEVRAIFKRTSVIMAFEDPLGAGGDAAEVAGQAARVNLATEVNQAILQSQGRPAHPALERIYRQTAASLTQLALMGNGSAAFVDMPRELLDA